MFGRRRNPSPASPPAGNRLAPRSGVLGADTFPWEDELTVLAAESRKLCRPEAPAVVLAPDLAVAALSAYGVPVLGLED
jgi:hypothetical protein